MCRCEERSNGASSGLQRRLQGLCKMQMGVPKIRVPFLVPLRIKCRNIMYTLKGVLNFEKSPDGGKCLFSHLLGLRGVVGVFYGVDTEVSDRG